MTMKNELPGIGIRHVVVLMLENRGFDHVMGWLYNENVKPADFDKHEDDDRDFLGLSLMDRSELTALSNPSPTGQLLSINKGARSPKTPSFNTGESFEHIMNQVWTAAHVGAVWFDADVRRSLTADGTPEAEKMRGYVLDYNLEVTHADPKANRSNYLLSEVLDTYLPEQMPVLSGLARHYAVSDEWFCSVPSQTNTNRAFSLSGTSRGMVNNSFYDPETYNPGIEVMRWKDGRHKAKAGKSHSDELPVSTRCLFEVLQQHNYNWKVYWQGEWPPKALALGMEWQYTRTMFPFLRNAGFDGNFVKFDASKPDNKFFEDCRNGRLPAVSWIEPLWGGGPAWGSPIRGVGNDYHPVSDTTTGEDFVMAVYQALTSHENWQHTLLIITFDENGGTYDHVIPWRDAAASGNDACPLPKLHIDRGDMDQNTRTQFGFDFKQMGVRVPTLLISPWAPAGTVFRSPSDVPFDHTSIISSILTMAGVPKEQWQMGERVAASPTFNHLLRNKQNMLKDYGSALRVTECRSSGPELTYDTEYILEYVGRNWDPGDYTTVKVDYPENPSSQPWYLSSAVYGKGHYFSYPTLTTDVSSAVTFTLTQPGSSQRHPDTPISNMSMVCIKTTEWSPLRNNLLTATTTNRHVHYTRDSSAADARWQLRIQSSRYAADKVRENDLVSFFTQYELSRAQTTTSLTTPDPLQRLVPAFPKDPQNHAPLRATTRAGEWGLWRIKSKS